jgi:uncharacterized protein with von Willebrand factor type A (vWA) domain
VKPRKPYIYGSFTGGPDPLAPLVDAGFGVDEIGERIIKGQSVQDALRDLMRTGSKGRQGLDQLYRQIRDRYDKVRESASMNGLLDDLKEMLTEAIELENAALFPDPSDGARFAEAMLDALPQDVPNAMKELDNYQWRSAAAEQLFEEMKDKLRRDVIDQQFAGMSQSMDQMATPENKAAMAAMMQDLNQLLSDHRAGISTQEQYQEFIDKHKGFFPDAPETLDQFIDDLARQSAALDRMLESMSPEQRAHLLQAMQQALSDLGVEEEMSKLQDNLKALRPEFSRHRGSSLSGDSSSGLPGATQALAEMGDLENLVNQISDADHLGDLTQIDLDLMERVMGRSLRDELEAMAQLQKDLEDQGFLVKSGDSMSLSAKAVRRIGQSALTEVFKHLEGTARGEHQMHRAGKSGEATGTHRPWSFGDDGAIDVVRTTQNATQRRVATGDSTVLHPDDFAIAETENLTKAAVVLLVDQSYSMLMNDTWGAAKTMALALHSLSSTKYPLDALQVIGFSNLARVVKSMEIPDLEASQVPGTNLQHALLLAGRFLDKHRGSQRIVMVVTDGEPTAHLIGDNDWWFNWPPENETIQLTVQAIDEMTRRKVAITWFRLGDDPQLARFLDNMARRNGGRVLATDPENLGDYVISDYVNKRRSAQVY